MPWCGRVADREKNHDPVAAGLTLKAKLYVGELHPVSLDGDLSDRRPAW
jgi:hypothetical protein